MKKMKNEERRTKKKKNEEVSSHSFIIKVFGVCPCDEEIFRAKLLRST